MRLCVFSTLPPELKLEVIDYLDDKRDLYNASKTCRWLEDAVLKRLYRSVDVEIPSQQSLAWSTGRYLNLRPHVVESILEITIRDQLDMYDGCELAHGNGPASPETYLYDVLAQIPSNQLKSFSSMHRNPVSPRTLRLLSDRNCQSLQNFSCYEIGCSDSPPSALPSKLQSIECRNIGKENTLARLLQANKSTLQTLCLGEERQLVEQYTTQSNGYRRHSSQPLTAIKEYVDLIDIPNLRRLTLIGLDLTNLLQYDVDQALFFARLEEITIESCVGTPAFLSTLASIFILAQADTTSASVQTLFPLLKKFKLRQEIFTPDLKDALLRFLNSFSGLLTLSLLFENTSVNIKPADIISDHGKTLQELVIESRIQPRQSLHLDTSRPFGSGGYSSQTWEESINDVCQLCPNLSELGIGFPWNDETIRFRPSQVSTLPRLKAMHVRNFPEAPHLSQMGDYSIRQHATKFMEWTFGDVRGERPQLETLSIGPAIYESRFKGANPTRKQVPEFLRTHHFTLDWAKTRFGRWSPMITRVSEKYMEEMRGEKPLGGVFEQVWLK